MLCLMALFLCGIVLFVLLITLRPGGYQYLVRLVVWLLLILILLVIAVVRTLHLGFLWFVGFYLFGKDFDCTPRGYIGSFSSTRMEEVASGGFF